MPRQKLSYDVLLARSVAVAVVVASLAGCSKTDRTGASSSTIDDAGFVGRRITTQYLKAHGGTLDACFGPTPPIRGPGDVQTVADDTKAKLTAINRLVIAIDSSGSMAARIGDETKMQAAKRAAISFLGRVPADTQVGLVAFGHLGNNLLSGKAESCRGVKTIYPLGSANPAQITAVLGRVQPVGWTPLAGAITAAGKEFSSSQTPGAQMVYVVSDGIETCGGDPVAAARTLNQGPVKAIVNIIGFDLAPADRAQLTAVASAGGGSFVEARTGSDLDGMMDELRRKARAASAMTTEYFDAGARSTDNNFAVGRYTTDLNFCIAHATSAETVGLQNAIDADKASIPESEAAKAILRQRHQAYVERSSKVAADLLGRSKLANEAITAQQHRSEERLGVAR